MLLTMTHVGQSSVNPCELIQAPRNKYVEGANSLFRPMMNSLWLSIRYAGGTWMGKVVDTMGDTSCSMSLTPYPPIDCNGFPTSSHKMKGGRRMDR
eukprot:scaffold25800_cov162-Cylindrotheca_fusiformis.AAC.7